MSLHIKSYLRRHWRRLKKDPWLDFAWNVRRIYPNLLTRLDDFDDAVLVAGCQRSGTTMLARIIRESHGMVEYWSTEDDEYDAACILSGYVAHKPEKGRYCFQTTYLNERYVEYFEHRNHYLLWMTRNPYSVVHSMLHNWRDYALNELFYTCGYGYLSQEDLYLHARNRLPRIKRAAYAYVGKTAQITGIAPHYSPARLLVIDYDYLVRHSSMVLRRVYDHVGVNYRDSYANKISNSSLGKKVGLSSSENRIVSTICDMVYEQTRQHSLLISAEIVS